MKHTKHFLALPLAGLLLLSSCTRQSETATQTPQSVSLAQAQETYLANVDVDYSYALAKKLSEIRSNAVLGYRTAGSQAELDTGDLLKKEMEHIGLTAVTKDAFTLDTWTFETAQLTYTTADGTEKTVELGGYQTDFHTDGPKTYTIMYAKRGTPADLEGLDVQGKLLLIDINQRDDWWINYPAYEAHLAGAAAVLAAQDGGYGEVSPDALNAQDFCGPADAPAFSISRTDAQLLQEVLSQSANGEATVTLNAKSTVGLDGESYNIVGTIPGRDPDAMVLMSAHYDSYFEGFQDDNAAIALMLGIAKGIVDSGYQPEKTLVFCAMAAEEWGVTNTRYDWSTGAYNQIFRVHPDWVGKVVADLNFELPAMSEGDKDQIRTSYELKTFTEAFIPKVPKIEGVFSEGIEVIVPTQTWSDDFSLSIAGIPSCVTALRGGFAKTHYHSQYDNTDTYHPDAFLFHHNMYGQLLLEYDRCAISPLDFSTRLSALQECIDSTLLSEAGADVTGLSAALEKAIPLAHAAYQRVQTLNTDYRAALDAGDLAQADTILAKSRQANQTVLATFRAAEDALVRLTWEDVSIFPHEHAQGNLAALKGAVTALEAGDVATALDEYLYLVDNNWYAYDWSQNTFHYFTDYVLNQPADRLMWGAGRVQGHENLYQVIQMLQAQRETGGDLSHALELLQEAQERQTVLLRQQVDQEMTAISALTEALETLAV